MTQDPSSSPFSTPQSVAGSVETQDGSVVSREVLKKKTGTVTLFAFDEGEGLSEHSTPHDAVVEVLDGTVEITIGGVPHRVSARQRLLLLPASVPSCACRPLPPFKMLLIMIREPGGSQPSSTPTGAAALQGPDLGDVLGHLQASQVFPAGFRTAKYLMWMNFSCIWIQNSATSLSRPRILRRISFTMWTLLGGWQFST